MYPVEMPPKLPSFFFFKFIICYDEGNKGEEYYSCLDRKLLLLPYCHRRSRESVYVLSPKPVQVSMMKPAGVPGARSIPCDLEADMAAWRVMTRKLVRGSGGPC